MTPGRWKIRPHGSTWGDFGPDDQVGRLNLLTSRRLLDAREEIREGRTFCLSLPLDYPGGRALSSHRAPPCISPIDPDGRPRFNFRCDDGSATDVECDDSVALSLQYSTHWDSLAHVGQMFDADDDGVAEPVYYNGFRAGEDIGVPSGVEGDAGGARKLGIETVAERCLQARGVLIDLHHHLGSRPGPQAVGYDAVRRIMAADGVRVEEGDVVCIHTGLGDTIMAMGKRPDRQRLAASAIGLDGRDPALLDWISASGLVALAADNFAVEYFPALPARREPAAALPLHEHCLFKLGVPLGELWYLGELARWLRAAGRYRFMLTAPPLRLTGAAGSPVTPVATV